MQTKLPFRNSPAVRLIVLFTLFFFFLLIAGGAGAALGQIGGISTKAILLGSSAIQCVIAFCCPAWVTARFSSDRPFRFTGLSERVSLRPFVGVVVVYILALPALNQIIAWNEAVHFPEWGKTVETTLRAWEEQNGNVARQMLANNGVAGMLLCVLVVGLLTGFSEELFFRGTMQRIFAGLPISKVTAVWVVAVIFSAMHFQFFGFIPRLLMGAFFGYLFIWTGSLWPSIFAHALNNSLVVVGTWLTDSVTSDGFDSLGVAANGQFPFPAVGSIVATAIFLWGFKGYFFRQASPLVEETPVVNAD